MDNPLPPLSPDERASLKASIEQHGVLTPITVDEDGNIIDGFNRSEIAAELGIECPRRVVAGLDENGKYVLAVELNAARRQLSKSAKRELAEQLHLRGQSVRQIAKSLGLGKSTVARWFATDVTSVPNGTPGEKPSETAQAAPRPLPEFSLKPIFSAKDYAHIVQEAATAGVTPDEWVADAAIQRLDAAEKETLL